jgi:hypothetical protein
MTSMNAVLATGLEADLALGQVRAKKAHGEIRDLLEDLAGSLGLDFWQLLLLTVFRVHGGPDHASVVGRRKVAAVITRSGPTAVARATGDEEGVATISPTTAEEVRDATSDAAGGPMEGALAAARVLGTSLAEGRDDADALADALAILQQVLPALVSPALMESDRAQDWIRAAVQLLLGVDSSELPKAASTSAKWTAKVKTSVTEYLIGRLDSAGATRDTGTVREDAISTFVDDVINVISTAVPTRQGTTGHSFRFVTVGRLVATLVLQDAAGALATAPIGIQGISTPGSSSHGRRVPGAQGGNTPSGGGTNAGLFGVLTPGGPGDFMGNRGTPHNTGGGLMFQRQSDPEGDKARAVSPLGESEPSLTADEAARTRQTSLGRGSGLEPRQQTSVDGKARDQEGKYVPPDSRSISTSSTTLTSVGGGAEAAAAAVNAEAATATIAAVVSASTDSTAARKVFLLYWARRFLAMSNNSGEPDGPEIIGAANIIAAFNMFTRGENYSGGWATVLLDRPSEDSLSVIGVKAGANGKKVWVALLVRAATYPGEHCAVVEDAFDYGLRSLARLDALVEMVSKNITNAASVGLLSDSEAATRCAYVVGVAARVKGLMSPFCEGAGLSSLSIPWYLQRWAIMSIIWTRAMNRTSIPVNGGTPGRGRFEPAALEHYARRLDEDCTAIKGVFGTPMQNRLDAIPFPLEAALLLSMVACACCGQAGAITCHPTLHGAARKSFCSHCHGKPITVEYATEMVGEVEASRAFKQPTSAACLSFHDSGPCMPAWYYAPGRSAGAKGEKAGANA